MSQSRIIFLIRGVRKAFFSSVGNSAQDNETFTIVVRTGASWSWHCLSSHVGIGSRAHDFVGDELIIFRISASETTINCSKETPQNMQTLCYDAVIVHSMFSPLNTGDAFMRL